MVPLRSPTLRDGAGTPPARTVFTLTSKITFLSVKYHFFLYPHQTIHNSYIFLVKLLEKASKNFFTKPFGGLA